MSRFNEAKAEADRACDVDPFCVVVTTSAVWVRYAARDFAAAIDRGRHVLEMDSGFAPARRLLGAALLGAGRIGEAIDELAAVATREPDDRIALSWLAHAKAAAGAHREAAALVEQLDTTAADAYVPGYHLALAHTGLGRPDRAFALLERACRDREPAVINVRVEPRFEPLRRDPRYANLLRTLRLPE
jgi:tetratricopeptide (TPR) repeat protein